MFKVVPDQLKISEGWVRCGHCTEIFDASANLQAKAVPDLRSNALSADQQPQASRDVVSKTETFAPSVSTDFGEGQPSQAPDTGGVTYQAQPFPMPPMPVAPKPVAPTPVPEVPASVDPDADGHCPVTQPIKGKLTSGIYHQPGGFAYERTKADRCYRDALAAESDGLRAAKR